MKTPHDCNDMTDIRTAIDSIDEQIVQLVAKRSQYVKQAAKFKKDETAVRDAGRVATVIASKRKLAEIHGIDPELIENIYKTMIEFFINNEITEWKSHQ